MKQSYRFILFVALSTLLLLLHISRNWTITSTPQQVENYINKQLGAAQQALAHANFSSTSTPPKHLFVYLNDTLKQWSDNTTPAPRLLPKTNLGLLELSNGIYVFAKKAGNANLVYLKCIQSNSSIQNKYFNPKNDFPGQLSLQPKSGFEQLPNSRQTLFYARDKVSLSSLTLFNPDYYASSQLNTSLGFLLIHLFWLTSLLSLLLHIQWRGKLGSFFRIVALLFITQLINYVLGSLVYDSKLATDPFNFLQLTAIDLVFPAVLFILAYQFLLAYRFLRFETLTKKLALTTLLAVTLLYNLVAFLADQRDLIEINWSLPLLVFTALHKPNSHFPNLKPLLAALTIAFGTYFVLNKHRDFKIISEQRLIADKMANNDDPIVEYLIEERIAKLERGNQTWPIDTLAYLNETIFTGYLSSYKAVELSRHNPVFAFTFLNKPYAFANRYNNKTFGFPQLLANRDFSDFVGKGYSQARYTNHILSQASGSYAYPRLLTNFSSTEIGQQHLVQQAANETLVVSYPVRSLPYEFAFLTYLFVLAYLAAALLYRNRLSTFSSLQHRTRFSFVALLVFSGIAFGIFAYYNLFHQFEEKNKELLAEKIESVKQALSENHLDTLLRNSGILATELSKLGENLFTDISLYNTNGQLISTSQPDIFIKGLLSENIAPTAFHQLKQKGLNLFVNRETVGNLTYLSAYSPLTDENNMVLCYVNLPYFAKQIELTNQLSDFLVSVIVVWVLLIVVGFALAIFLANRITEPLKLVREKLQQLDFKQVNQQIDYQRNDEIGELVAAYNSKVQELLAQADALAKSERESAWREMAKQVAHEIKNPLTPIKLNAQLLQRSLENNDADIKEKTSRFVSGLIEQVNTLTKIANEFSNYASLPKAIPETIQLDELVKNTVSIMADEKVSIELNIEPAIQVYADKSLMTRVVNNLLKNAIQATEEKAYGDTEKPQVVLSLTKKDTLAVLMLTDNGNGIPNDKQQRIFTPNFTTKSTGMGLGLAMVQQIVEQAGGHISFESEPGLGTTFTVKLPLHLA